MTHDRNGKELAIGDVVKCLRGRFSGKRHMVIEAFDYRRYETYLVGKCLETNEPVKWLSNGVIYQDT